MKLHKVFATAGVMAALYAGSVQAGQCVKVDCDCSSIGDENWRQVCQRQESEVRDSCVASGGVLKSYCGLHGPNAFPVAISLKTTGFADQSPDIDVRALEKQIKTQTWSLQDSLATLKKKEDSQKFGEAIQLLGLFERDIDRLYSLQKQKLVLQQKNDRSKVARSDAQDYSEQQIDKAEELSSYSEQLWQKAGSASDKKSQKAYSVLSFKLTRLVASIYEQSADLLAITDQYERAAQTWQKASTVANQLMEMEIATENKARHVQFYQAQATARLNRATFYWLKTDGHLEQVQKNTRLANQYTDKERTVAEIEAAHDHDAGDMRAMKRPSR